MTPLELERQPLVIDSQAVQDSGLNIVDMHRVGDNVVGVVVSFSMRNSAFDPAAVSDGTVLITGSQLGDQRRSAGYRQSRRGREQPWGARLALRLRLPES